MQSALHASEQFGALYMHNHDDNYPARPGFELVPPGYKPQSIRMNIGAGRIISRTIPGTSSNDIFTEMGWENMERR